MSTHWIIKRGYSLIEIVISVAILAAFFSGAIVANYFELKIVNEGVRRGRAAYLAEEGLEAARIVRDMSWSNNIAPLVSGTTYYPTFSINWKIISSDPGPIEGTYRRTVVFDDVYRKNNDDDIVDVSSLDPKYLDSSTKKITVAVSWTSSDGSAKVETISTYLADLFSN